VARILDAKMPKDATGVVILSNASDSKPRMPNGPHTLNEHSR
jgi:hypothetical protein